MPKTIEYNATLVERIDLTEKLAIFRIRPDEDWSGARGGQVIPDFEGGQYLVIGLNNEQEPEKGAVLRPYSICSPPEEKRWMEFYVRRVDYPTTDNPLTHLLFELKPGDRCHLGRKITGHFTLERTVGIEDPRLRVFVAAGTGLAPFVSILLSQLRKGASPKQFAILHGARYQHDFGYKQDFQRLFQELPKRYLPTVSDERPDEDLVGFGRVETFFDAEKLTTLEGRLGFGEGELTPERAVVYICGFYGTIHNTLVNLLTRGFVPNDRRIRKALGLEDEPPSLFFEQYDDAPILDVQNREEMERLLEDTPFADRVRK